MTYIPAGSARTAPWTLEITPELAGWTYTGLRTAHEAITFDTGDEEMLVVPLDGGCVVEAEGERIELTGRNSVFASATDFAYLPIGVRATIRPQGRVALPAARATRRLPIRYGPAADVPVEIRGAGRATRRVRNFCAPGVFDCDRLMAVEVITPDGNWSSYPPHKHDNAAGGHEAVLEEIYYFEGGPGYQRVYGTHEVLAEVSQGDVVLVPHGYHGPSMASPGYDLYYLNVLAGPGERSMAFSDDPRYAWIRDSWRDQDVDPRLA